VSGDEVPVPADLSGPDGEAPCVEAGDCEEGEDEVEQAEGLAGYCEIQAGGRSMEGEEWMALC
jgi:hypothetical protein